MFELELNRGKSPTEQLISDWGTSNATVQDLVNILEELEMLSCIDILLPGKGIRLILNTDRSKIQKKSKVQNFVTVFRITVRNAFE